jgi:hypothetical protein
VIQKGDNQEKVARHANDLFIPSEEQEPKEKKKF